jgi:hypothetical protein
LQEQVEKRNAAIEKRLIEYLTNDSVVRVFSLRHEFPTAFSRLFQSPPNTEVKIKIVDTFLPFFLTGRIRTTHNLVIGAARLALKTRAEQEIGELEMAVDRTQAKFTAERLAGLQAADLDGTFASHPWDEHTLIVTNAGEVST